MKVLLDEHMPHALRSLIVGHDVYTVAYMGWAGTRKGALLRRAADAGFDLLLTLDDSIEHQQNLRTLPVGVLVASAASTDPGDLRTLVPAILRGMLAMEPRTIGRVP